MTTELNALQKLGLGLQMLSPYRRDDAYRFILANNEAKRNEERQGQERRAALKQSVRKQIMDRMSAVLSNPQSPPEARQEAEAAYGKFMNEQMTEAGMDPTGIPALSHSFAPKRDIQFIDQGDTKTAVDMGSVVPGQTFKVSEQPKDAILRLQSARDSLEQKIAQEQNPARKQHMERNLAEINKRIQKDGTGTTVNVNTEQPFKIPSGFMLANMDDPSEGVVPIPGGPAATLTPEQAAKLQMVAQGQGEVDEFKQMLIGDDGQIDRILLGNMTARTPFSDGRKAYSLIFNAIEAKLRAESGAAVPETEVTRMAKRLVPSIMDNDATVNLKLNILEKFLTGTADLIDPTGSIRGRKDVNQRGNELQAQGLSDSQVLEKLQQEGY